METTMYDDNMRTVKKMKSNMTLDFAAAVGRSMTAASGALLKQEKVNLNEMGLLGSPDFNLLMLTSPDLERIIIQQNNVGLLTTPTPTTQILFPKTVTEEQEAYARGFIDALGELHRQTPAAAGAAVVPVAAHQSNGLSTVVKPSTTVYTATSSTTTQLPGSVLSIKPRTVAVPASSTAVARNVRQVIPTTAYTLMGAAPSRVSAEPQHPAPTSTLMPTNIAPIDMNDQEMQKLERKRARNRVAATRCRNRKLERISRLEERVQELKGQNSQLAQTASTLRDQVCRLKQNIIEHTNMGCQVMLTHNLL